MNSTNNKCRYGEWYFPQLTHLRTFLVGWKVPELFFSSALNDLDFHIYFYSRLFLISVAILRKFSKQDLSDLCHENLMALHVIQNATLSERRLLILKGACQFTKKQKQSTNCVRSFIFILCMKCKNGWTLIDSYRFVQQREFTKVCTCYDSLIQVCCIWFLFHEMLINENPWCLFTASTQYTLTHTLTIICYWKYNNKRLHCK